MCQGQSFSILLCSLQLQAQVSFTERHQVPKDPSGKYFYFCSSSFGEYKSSHHLPPLPPLALLLPLQTILQNNCLKDLCSKPLTIPDKHKASWANDIPRSRVSGNFLPAGIISHIHDQQQSRRNGINQVLQEPSLPRPWEHGREVGSKESRVTRGPWGSPAILASV